MNANSKNYSPRWFMGLGILTLIVLIGGVGLWFSTTQISGAVIASGQVHVDQNRQIVQHRFGGIVEDILVDEGQFVDQDAVLVRLDATEFSAELQIVAGQLAEILARRSRLLAERDGLESVTFDPQLDELAERGIEIDELVAGQKRLFDARQTNQAARITRLNNRIEQIRNQIVGIEAQRDANTDQQVLLQDELQNQQTLLDQGLAQAGRVLALQREDARLRGLVGNLIAQKAQAEGQITELEVEMLNLQDVRREEAISILRDIQLRQLELTERRIVLQQRLDDLEVRAPTSGIIYDLDVFARKSVIRPADPLMYVVPQDKPLVVEARIAPSDIEQLYLEQPVSLKFSSFSQRTSPTLFGAVSRISADTFQDSQTGMPFYLIEVVLNEGEVTRLPEGAVLLPGMPVDCFVETASRTAMSYMLQPFTDYIARAFRES